MAYRFKVISDNLVECTDTENDDKTLLTEEEAILVGFRPFTYKGETIKIPVFANLIDRNYTAVIKLVEKYSYTSGEQVIEHYDRLDANRITYGGKTISIRQLADMTGRDYAVVCRAIHKNSYTTGEQVIAHFKDATAKYDYDNIHIDALAKRFGKTRVRMMHIVRNNGLKSDEDVIDFMLATCKLLYRGEPIKYCDLAVVVNESVRVLTSAVKKNGFTTGEQVIEYFDKIHKDLFTYNGARMYVGDFARMIGKPSATVRALRSRHGFTTGEQIIEYYRSGEYNRNNVGKITYGGKNISITRFAEMVGKHENTIRRLVKRHGFTTGEQIIEYYRRKGKL